jgi:hypothetical protein
MVRNLALSHVLIHVDNFNVKLSLRKCFIHSFPHISVIIPSAGILDDYFQEV